VNELADRREMLRGLLTVGAMASVVIIPAIGAEETSDPVHALITARKATWARFEGIDLVDDEALEEMGRAADAALDEITNTPPRTLAGMRAVMEHLVDLDGHSDSLPTLLRSSILRSPLLTA
jgi:hypothetical protein